MFFTTLYTSSESVVVDVRMILLVLFIRVCCRLWARHWSAPYQTCGADDRFYWSLYSSPVPPYLLWDSVHGKTCCHGRENKKKHQYKESHEEILKKNGTWLVSGCLENSVSLEGHLLFPFVLLYSGGILPWYQCPARFPSPFPSYLRTSQTLRMCTKGVPPTDS